MADIYNSRGTPPPPTTPLAGGAFNGIGAHEGILLSLIGGGFFGLAYENFCGHPFSFFLK